MTLNDLISTKHFDEKEYNSLMNSSHQRKENNTEIHDYNCGGYAFETYNWVELFDGADTVEDVVEAIGEDCQDKFLYNEIMMAMEECDYSNPYLLEYFIYQILNAFPDIRLINNFEELEPDEYGIAFRTCEDDFHFCKYKDGVFSHKPGSWAVEEIEEEEDAWEDRYYSNIYRFARKES